MPPKRHSLYLIAILAGVLTAPVSADEVVRLEPRQGVSLRYLLLPASGAPKAAVVLLVGGDGIINLGKDGSIKSRNFLARTRNEFRTAGLLVGLPEVPSDRTGGYGSFRSSEWHTRDIAAVVADLKRRVEGVPVWLVGTSRGSISATAAAGSGVAGIVLSSPVTRGEGGGNKETVFDAKVENVKVPVLLLSHRNDGCKHSPPGDLPSIASKLAVPVKTVIISGASPSLSDPCRARSPHGFLNQEEPAVAAIVDFINSGGK